MSEQLSAQLLELLGPAAFLQLVEAFGGLRIYVPDRKRDETIDAAIGIEASAKLHGMWGGSLVRVPLAQGFRARAYRAAGIDNRTIARRLCMTETGLEKLFRRAGHPRRGRRPDTRQSDLFS